MTSSTEPIRGKVARILNTRELALNVGSQDGVQLGMRFNVLDTKGEDICDPDSNEVLGSLQRPKVQVEVTRVEPRLSVAATFRSNKVNVGGTGGLGVFGVQKLFEPPKWVKKYETLKTDEWTWEDLDEEDSYVKTGDPVVQVLSRDESKNEGEGDV